MVEPLNVRNRMYQQWVLQVTLEEMKQDFGGGDVTTEAYFGVKEKVSVIVVMKQDGIVCGFDEIKFFLKKLPQIKVKFLKRDGDRVKYGDIALRLTGSVRDLMKVERVILNFIGRMSGIATYTKRYVDIARKINPDVLITPTRKTLWGWLDKKACVVGGGGTHRLSLNDALLIKHNHIKASRVDIQSYLQKSIQRARGRFVEIEVRSYGDALKVAQTFTEAVIGGFKKPCLLMMDNISPRDIKCAITAMKKNKTYENVLIEASGGINEKNLASFVKTGADIISIGALTHSADMFDCSMRVE